MKWSFKIARFFGIDVYVHQTFFLLLLFFGISGYSQNGSMVQAANSVVFIAALFGCVVLHEYGHALTARRFGIRTTHITLLPIGGLAAMEKMPDKPSQELLVAIAGPAVNIVIAALIYLWLQVSPHNITEAQLTSGDMPLTVQLLVVNIFLAAFNLIPAFPMDGGRVLRAIFAMRMDYSKATSLASSVGKGFAILFAAYGIYSGNFMLTLIAGFLWFAGTAENRATQFKEEVKHLNIGHVMTQRFSIISSEDSIGTAERMLQQSEQQDFPIGTREHITHVLSHQELMQAIEAESSDLAIKQLPLSTVLTVDINCHIDELIEQLKKTPFKMVAVTDKGKLVGIIGMQQILALANM